MRRNRTATENTVRAWHSAKSEALKHPGDKAVGFDGKGAYVEIPSNTAFSQPTSGRGLTVEVWLNPKSLEFKGETGDPYVYWIGKGEPGQYEWRCASTAVNRRAESHFRIYLQSIRRSGGRRVCSRAAATKRMDSHRRLFRSRLRKQSEGGRFDLQERRPQRRSRHSTRRTLQQL